MATLTHSKCSSSIHCKLDLAPKIILKKKKNCFIKVRNNFLVLSPKISSSISLMRPLSIIQCFWTLPSSWIYFLFVTLSVFLFCSFYTRHLNVKMSQGFVLDHPLFLMQGIRISCPKMCHFDIRIILSQRQMRPSWRRKSSLPSSVLYQERQNNSWSLETLISPKIASRRIESKPY